MNNNSVGLKRDSIKYLAVITMFINHAAIYYLPGTSIFRMISEGIGRFTAITMVYFLVEGYFYTKDLRKYFLRLFIFALISQLPFYLVINYIYGGFYLNFLFTLILCMCCIYIYKTEYEIYLKIICFAIIFVFSFFCDWGYIPIIMTILFLKQKDNIIPLYAVYLISIVITAFNDIINIISGKMHIITLITGTLFMWLSYAVLRFLYTGERINKNHIFHKAFFYVFYPLHLLIIYFIGQLII